MARITVAQLAAQQDERNAKIDETLAVIVGTLGKITQAQFATPAAVAEVTTPAPTTGKKSKKAAKVADEAQAVVEPVAPKAAPVVVQSNSDKARAFVESKGLAFARGGRTTGTVEVAKAIVRVLQTGTPEVVTFEGLGSLDKRRIVGVVVFKTDKGDGFNTQYLFDPAAAEA